MVEVSAAIPHSRAAPGKEFSIQKLHGNTVGLKPGVRKKIEKLYQRRVSPQQVISPELARSLTELSRESGRVLGILVDRKGNVEDVIVGDAKGIVISEMGRYRVSKARFRGLRCIHTRLTRPDGHRGANHDHVVSQDDLTDLALLRFDLMVVIETGQNGLPGDVHIAHLVPGRAEFDGEQMNWEVLPATSIHDLDLNFSELIDDLEREFAARARTAQSVSDRRRRAILVHVSRSSMEEARESMDELRELARSANLVVVDEVLQRRTQFDGKYVVGRGKMNEIFIRSLQKGADLIIFDHELSGSQVRSIGELTDLEVIDRTQLILDIFAQRAKSRDGKIQVELAQLKYSLPRLVLKDDCLSRITGGIGARGPGETKIEELKRQVQTRIKRLENDIESLSRGRDERRKRREQAGIPVVSIVGYTNAGKSTLLNALTGSDVLAENKYFATLDPTTRRVRFPQERELILADTVGFLRELPHDLVNAFRATLEELREADLIIHLVDMSNPAYEDQIAAVEDLLSELGVDNAPTLLVFNKEDLVDAETAEDIRRRYRAISISALKRNTLPRLTKAVEDKLWTETGAVVGRPVI